MYYRLIFGMFVELARRGIFQVENIACKLDNGALEAEANAQIGTFVGTCPIRRCYHAFGASCAKSTWNQHSTNNQTFLMKSDYILSSQT